MHSFNPTPQEDTLEDSDTPLVTGIPHGPAASHVPHHTDDPNGPNSSTVVHAPPIARANFLSLPKELREMIYREALVEDRWLDITRARKPTLSFIVKDDREEIIKIFYHKNKWEATISNYNHEPLMHFSYLPEQYQPMVIQVRMKFTNGHDELENNLLKWLKEVYDKKGVGLAGCQSQYEWHVRVHRVKTIFSYCRSLRDEKNLDWIEAESHLRWFIKVAGVCNEPDRLH